MPPSTPSRSRNPTFVELSQLPTYKGTSKARLQALYADFARQKHSSPAAFRANLDWWAQTLRALVDRRLQPGCPHGLVLRTNANLPDTFRYEGVGKPLSLGAVIVRIPTAHCARVYLERVHPGRKADLVLLAKTELTFEKQLFPLSKFLSAPYSVYDPGSTAYWLVSTIVGKPLWWALQQTGIVGTEESTETDAQRWRRVASDYVVLPLVEQAADRILEHQETIDNGSAADTVYSWEGFKKTFGGLALENGSMSDEDVKVVVKFLQRDRHVVAADKQVGHQVQKAYVSSLQNIHRSSSSSTRTLQRHCCLL
jgi:charged multivesicular body protein 7